jgi:hypothetical protein
MINDTVNNKYNAAEVLLIFSLVICMVVVTKDAGSAAVNECNSFIV